MEGGLVGKIKIGNIENSEELFDYLCDVSDSFAGMLDENDLEYEDGEKWKNVGDIVISLETLSKNAEYFEVSENLELKRLLIHGLLHLNGYDHGEEHIEKNKEPECEMLKIQENLLKEFEDFTIIDS